MIKFEYEKGIKNGEREIFETLEEFVNNIPNISIHNLMKYLDVYETPKDLSKYRIGSGTNHIFVCRLNRNFDRILLITEE